MYRIGFPFWKQVARLGMSLKMRINVMRDREADVLVATSDDLPGLVCEVATMDELLLEVYGATHELLAILLQSDSVSTPVTDFRMKIASIATTNCASRNC
ncbi:MAG: hypothetical protein RL748_3492 [Pseudomonadota bacterium]|jgi:hypothetical protein